MLYIRYKINKSLTGTSRECEILQNLLIDSFNFYMERYNAFENEIYIAACMLNPNCFNFNYEEEKRKFHAICKTYIQEID